MKKKINTCKGIPQQIAGNVENIKQAIKKNCKHVLKAEKFIEKGKSYIFDLCVDLVLLARSVKQNPTYGGCAMRCFVLIRKRAVPLSRTYTKSQSRSEKSALNFNRHKWETCATLGVRVGRQYERRWLAIQKTSAMRF